MYPIGVKLSKRLHYSEPLSIPIVIGIVRF